jgi:hypothetical protein
VPTRSQRARSVPTFFAQDSGIHNLVYANADLAKATQNREAIAFCDHWQTVSGADRLWLVRQVPRRREPARYRGGANRYPPAVAGVPSTSTLDATEMERLAELSRFDWRGSSSNRSTLLNDETSELQTGTRGQSSVSVGHEDLLRIGTRSRSTCPVSTHLGQSTVKTHDGHVCAKLPLRDRAVAVVFAFDHGLVRPSGDKEWPA